MPGETFLSWLNFTVSIPKVLFSTPNNFKRLKWRKSQFVGKPWHPGAEVAQSNLYWKGISLRGFPSNSHCKRQSTLSKIKWSGNMEELSLNFYLPRVPAWLWPWVPCCKWTRLRGGDSLSGGAHQPQLLGHPLPFREICTLFMLGQWAK